MVLRKCATYYTYAHFRWIHRLGIWKISSNILLQLETRLDPPRGRQATFTICSTNGLFMHIRSIFFPLGGAFIGGNPNNYMDIKQTIFTAHSLSIAACNIFSISVCNQANPDTLETLRETFTVFLSRFQNFTIQFIV